MQTFPSDFRAEVRKVGNRLGTPRPAWAGHLPNLPNLPNLFHLRAYTHTRARARIYARVPVSIMVGKVRKVRKNRQACGFQPSQPAPNLNIG